MADWTGRAIRDDKRGFIPKDLKRLGIDENAWIETVRDYGPRFRRTVVPLSGCVGWRGDWATDGSGA